MSVVFFGRGHRAVAELAGDEEEAVSCAEPGGGRGDPRGYRAGGAQRRQDPRSDQGTRARRRQRGGRRVHRSRNGARQARRGLDRSVVHGPDPELGLPLRIQRSCLAWFKGEPREAYGPERFPVFIRKSGHLDGWGIPDVDGRGAKVGAGPSVEKRWLDRPEDNWTAPDDFNLAPIEEFVREDLPGLHIADSYACMNSRTSDRDLATMSPCRGRSGQALWSCRTARVFAVAACGRVHLGRHPRSGRSTSAAGGLLESRGRVAGFDGPTSGSR
jgi:hypothetical protein